MRRQFFFALCVGQLWAGPAWAQATAGSSGQSSTSTTTSSTSSGTSSATVTAPGAMAEAVFTNLSGFSEDYRVGAGDLLDIQVVGHSDQNQSLRVALSGDVSFPGIGLVSVAEKTVFELEDMFSDMFRQKGLLNDAQVLVSVAEFQAKPIYVSGAVVNPGEFIMSQALTVADAILLAGGLRANASDHAMLHRRVSPEGDALPVAAITENPEVAKPGIEIVKVDIRPAKEGRFSELAIPLKRGDALIVTTQPMHAFYVVGEVNEPKNYFIPPGRTMTVSQAISQAQGPSPYAKLSAGMLIRHDATGKRQEILVNYAAILQGEQADMPIQENDIIYIPNSRGRRFTYDLVGMTDLMMMQQSFAMGRRMQRGIREQASQQQMQQGR